MASPWGLGLGVGGEIMMTMTTMMTMSMMMMTMMMKNSSSAILPARASAAHPLAPTPRLGSTYYTTPSPNASHTTVHTHMCAQAARQCLPFPQHTHAHLPSSSAASLQQHNHRANPTIAISRQPDANPTPHTCTHAHTQTNAYTCTHAPRPLRPPHPCHVTRTRPSSCPVLPAYTPGVSTT